MTPLTIVAALVTSLAVGTVLGFVLRRRPQGAVWATAIASAVGLILFQAQSLADLSRLLPPASAIAWMPWVCLVCLAAGSFGQSRVQGNGSPTDGGDPAESSETKKRGGFHPGRVVVFCGLSLFVVARLLWGSIYLRDGSMLLAPSGSLAMMIVWGFAASIPMIGLPAAGTIYRRREHVAWAAVVAVIALAIAMTGSLTYAVATATIGTGILGSLFGSGKIASVTATPLILMIGLAHAFSELPMLLALMMCVSLIILVAAWGRWPTKAFSGWFQWTAVANAAVVIVVVAIQFRHETQSDSSTSATPYRGYQSATGLEISHPQLPSPTATPPTVSSSPDGGDSMPDPFGGFGP